ncbi:MAG: NYN domain-containing protein [Kaiparowitsia implicata GSE-PSE-MK54-09C]|jgi:predicted RNA-binding protein with PIN domain|nr:NYN domain-containing protein [Kaiparowitsia implicata GSE-PSE-MK54-09C]
MARSVSQALLLVDGYNVIGTWPDLKQLCDRHSMAEARRSLTERLISFSAAKDYETQVVFDAHYQDIPGNCEAVTSYFSIYYTDYRQSADTYIEAFCAHYRQDARRHRQPLIVATSDRTHQHTVQGYGANWISSHRLRTEVELASQQVRRRQSSKRRSPGRFLGRSLDPVAQQRLADLQRGLEQQ